MFPESSASASGSTSRDLKRRRSDPSDAKWPGRHAGILEASGHDWWQHGVPQASVMEMFPGLKMIPERSFDTLLVFSCVFTHYLTSFF
jgi:hypothetical protein